MDPRPSRRLKGTLLAALLAAAGSLLSWAAPSARAEDDSLTVTMTPRDIWPPAPVADLAASAGAEGQMLLTWTAPDGNANVFATSSPAAGYEIRVASFSVAEIGGSTTAWWAAATDVLSLPSPAFSGSVPVPDEPGTAQSLLLNQLWPGVTHYAMIVSTDHAGNRSDADANSLAAQANALVFDAPPAVPQSVNFAQTSSRTITVSWNAVGGFDLDLYRVYVDTGAPYDFANAYSTQTPAPATSFALTDLSTGTYALKLVSVDRGQPRWPGVALESVQFSSALIVIEAVVRPAQIPYGLALSSDTGSVGLRWMPVVRYLDGEAFVDASAPAPHELSGYRVYRATSPTFGTWTEMAALSTATVTWTDLTGGPQHYYSVRSENSTGLSPISAVRTPATRSAFIVAPDDASYFEIRSSEVSPLEGVETDPYSAYLVVASSRPQDLGSLEGRVVKSLTFDAYRGGELLSPDFSIGAQGVLRMHYRMGTSTSVAPSGVSNTPQNLSVYWYNGKKWVQLYGTLDSYSQTMSIQTKFFGQYQLRTVERTGAFSFNQAGVSNRFLTPNGDGKNDNVVFQFDNPRGAEVTGKIIDLHGRVVVGSLPPGPLGDSLMWDGTAGGQPVPGGVYIYQISGEEQTYTGTLVIVK